MNRRSVWAGWVAILAAIMAGFGAGCEVGSPDEVVREAGISVGGYYTNPDGHLVSRNTGAPIRAMLLRQSGEELEGIDNNNYVFRGRISSASASSARFVLKGQTTAGVLGTIDGTIEVSGGTAIMRGTWIEPSLYGVVYGVATVPTNGGGGGGGTLTITPSGTITVARNSTTTFSASGGSGSYSWSVANPALGSISGSGSTVQYVAGNVVGTQTVSVASGGQTRSTRVIQM